MNKLAHHLTLTLALTLVSAGNHGIAADASARRSIVNGLAGDGASLRPVRWSVVGGSQARQVSSGLTTRVTVQADIARGWHIYSLTQKSGGPIPLRLELVGSADVLVRGLIEAPKPDRTFDKNFGIETELYSGSPRFTIPVGVAAHSPGGVRKFQVAARYQVCSDKLCLPPRTDKLDIALRIASRK